MVGKGKTVDQLKDLAKIKAEHAALTGVHANAAAGANAAAVAASAGPTATKQECLDRHKTLSYGMLTSCLKLVSGIDVPAITSADLAAAKLKLLHEQGCGDLLDKPAAAFKGAVLPDAIRLKAQQVYKSKVASSLLQAFIVTSTDPLLSAEALAVIKGLVLNIVRITTPPQQATTAGATAVELPTGFCNLDEPPSAVTDGLVFVTDSTGSSGAAAAVASSSSSASSTASARSRSMSTSQDDRQMLYDQEVSKHFITSKVYISIQLYSAINTMQCYSSHSSSVLHCTEQCILHISIACDQQN
jgi:hypothetical protein